MDEAGEQFVAYFVPTEETVGKRKRDDEEDIPYKADDEYVHVHVHQVQKVCILL